jgi:CheY-like chemotaxis protein
MLERPVLVVDDDPTIRQAVAEMLELAGYPVVTVSNGLAALKLLERLRPSLLVTDLHMPQLDGAGLVDALRLRGLDPPILVMTGTVRTPHQVAEALQADACLLKPFDLDAFLDLVAQLRIP